MNSKWNDVLNQKMDRKQFLKNAAAGVGALTGVGLMLKAFGPKENTSSATSTYGGSAYGGARDAKSQNAKLG